MEGCWSCSKGLGHAEEFQGVEFFHGLFVEHEIFPFSGNILCRGCSSVLEEWSVVREAGIKSFVDRVLF